MALTNSRTELQVHGGPGQTMHTALYAYLGSIVQLTIMCFCHGGRTVSKESKQPDLYLDLHGGRR